MENPQPKIMEKQADPQPPPNMQPPPYSELPPPNSMPIRSVPEPAAIYNTHPHRHGNYTSDTVLQTHVITQQPGATVHVVTRTNPFGPNPRTILCSRCQLTVTSTILQQPSLRTHLLAMSLCIIGFWPCVPMVYCMDCCTDVNHYCSNCNAYQGTFAPSL